MRAFPKGTWIYKPTGILLSHFTVKTVCVIVFVKQALKTQALPIPLQEDQFGWAEWKREMLKQSVAQSGLHGAAVIPNKCD